MTSFPDPRPDLSGEYTDLRREILEYLYRCGLTRDVAEDLTQETFTTLFRIYDRFDQKKGSLTQFTFGIARNHRRVWLRRNRLRLRIQMAFRPRPPTASPERSAIVADAVRQLPEPLREALVLREYHGMSYREIADLQSIPLGTVRSRLARARDLLKTTLRPRNFHEM